MAAGEVQLRMLAAQLRDEAGRFRRADPGKALDDMLLEWGRTAVATLREATPVEQGEPLQRGHPPPGTARASWRFDHVPSQHAVKVTNVAVDERGTPYLRFHVTGTPEADPGGLIYPKVAPMLVFYAKEDDEERGIRQGDLLRRRYVHGIQPNPQLVAAIERLGPTAAMLLNEKGITLMQEIAGMGTS